MAGELFGSIIYNLMQLLVGLLLILYGSVPKLYNNYLFLKESKGIRVAMIIFGIFLILFNLASYIVK